MMEIFSSPLAWAQIEFLFIGVLIGYVLGKIENHIRELRSDLLSIQREMQAKFQEQKGLCQFAIAQVKDVQETVDD